MRRGKTAPKIVRGETNMDKKKTFKKKWLVAVIAVLVLSAAVIVLVKGEKTPSRFSSPAPVSERTRIIGWEQLDSVTAPRAFDIGEIKYYRGDKGCCFCSAITYAYKEFGGRDYQQFFEDILAPSYERNMTGLFGQLAKYGLGDRLYFGFYGKEGGETKFNQTFAALLKNPAEQVRPFSSQAEAVEYLKKIVSLGIPVVVAIEDDMGKVKSPQNEVEDDTFVTVIGYNQQQVKLYWIPDTKNWMSWDEFIPRWKLQNTEFKYELIPGNFSLVFLSP